MLIPLRDALDKVGWHKFPKRWQDTIIDSEAHRSGLDLLYDPVPDYGAALRKVMGVYGLKGLSDEDIRLTFRSGAKEVIRRAFAAQPDREERDIEGALAAFGVEFRANRAAGSRSNRSQQRYKLLAEAIQLLATFVQRSKEDERVAFLDEAGHGRQPIDPGLWETLESKLHLNYASSLGQYQRGGLLSDGGKVWVDEDLLTEYLGHVEPETLAREDRKAATLFQYQWVFDEADKIVKAGKYPTTNNGKPNQSQIARLIRKRTTREIDVDTIRGVLNRNKGDWLSGG